MFKEMHRLWLLDIHGTILGFPQRLEYLPDSLKCLIWPCWSWKSLPSNFMAHNLVELQMPGSKLEKLWSEVQLGNLKYVNLRHSKNLSDVSALSRAPNLVSVDLSHCESLRQVPPLRFRICEKLTSLDRSCHTCDFVGCHTLGCLQLDFCTHLEVVEKISGNLKQLNLCSTSAEELPSSIWFLDNLEYLDLSFCYNLKSLPSDIQKLKSLRRLNLKYCLSLDKLPEFPKNLIELDLSFTSIKQVPSSSIEHLSSLQKLSLSGCWRLKSLPIGIKKLDLGDCNRLEIFPSTLEHLETLSFTSLCSLSSLKTLRLERSNIEAIPVSIKNLSKLIKLVVRGCNRLKSLPELPSSLELLDASECTSLETISNSRDALIQGLNSDNHVMTHRSFLYLDCLKLDQNSRNNIVSEFQLRALDKGIKAVLPYSVFKESDCPGVGFCFPGNEIPMWFTYQSESFSINIKLPSNWPNTNFLGFALCAARSSFSTTRLRCLGNFKTNSGKSWQLQWDFNLGDFHLLESSNIFMWYEHGNYLDAVEVSFYFPDVTASCGIRLLYRQDAEELGINNNLGVSNVEKTGAINSDTDDRRSIHKTSKPSRSSNEADLGEKLVTTLRRDGSGKALAEEANELGGFGEERVTGLAGMGHQHMDYDNVQTAAGEVDRQRRKTVGTLGSRRWTCWCLGKEKEERRRRRVIEEKNLKID